MESGPLGSGAHTVTKAQPEMKNQNQTGQKEKYWMQFDNNNKIIFELKSKKGKSLDAKTK